MDIYEWDEFVNRYLENKEEFFFNYKNFSFWLTTDNNNLPCVTITNHELISSQSIDGLFKVLNIFEKFKDSNEILHVINKKLINISSYEDMKKLLINSNERFVLDENTQIYSYNNNKSKQIVILTSYKSYQELLIKFMLDCKSIQQNWENLK